MRLQIEIQILGVSSRLCFLEVEPALIELIRIGQESCPKIREWRTKLNSGEIAGAKHGTDGLLRFQNRVCVPTTDGLRD